MPKRKGTEEPRKLTQFKLRPSVVERARDAVFTLNKSKKARDKPTLGDLVESGIEREVKRLERRHGEPFPERTGPVPAHRPKGARDRGKRKSSDEQVETRPVESKGFRKASSKKKP